MIKILLVDDHEIIRAGLRSVFKEIEGLEVVGEADNGEDAVKLNRELSPDLVIMDINMPGIGGLEATTRILQVKPAPKIIVISTYTNDILPSRLIEMGVSGYLTKQADEKEILAAIKKVMSGGRYIESDIMDKVVVTEDGEEPDPDNIKKIKQDGMFEALNEREMQVLLMMARGLDAAKISKKLFLTSKTVNAHRTSIKRKLSVATDVEAAKLAIQKGLVDADTEWH